MNIIKIADGVYRGSRPTEYPDFIYLQNLGIKYILDLETGAHLLKDGSPLADALSAAELGMRTFNHPLGNILPPTRMELGLACDVINKFKPIFVHCKAGVDRTGMVIAYWEFKHTNGYISKFESIYRMKKFGMHWWYYWWAWFLL